jgi:hypothetical protein
MQSVHRGQQDSPAHKLLTEDLDRAAAASLFAQNPRLVSMMQNKLSGLVGQSSGYVESLPTPIRRRVDGLKGVQKEHSKLEAQFQEEVLELEKKFFAKFTPLYEKRSKIINGLAEPTEEEIKTGEAEREDDESDDEAEKPQVDEEEEAAAADVKGIPEFWLSAMKNSSLAETITDRDEEVLKDLTDIRMEYLDRPGFRLIFEFSENAFFSNKTISKTYYYQEENGYGGDFIYDHAEGDKIDWKEGQDLTVKVESKKQRNKSKSRVSSLYCTTMVLTLFQTPSRLALSRRPSPHPRSSTSSTPPPRLQTTTRRLTRTSSRSLSLTTSSVRTSRRSSSPAPSTGSLARLSNSSTAWTTSTRTTSRMRMTLMMMRTATTMMRRRKMTMR